MTTLRKAAFFLGAAAVLTGAASAQAITPLVVEGDVLPLGTVTSTANVDTNNSGDWLVELDTDNADSAMDNAVVFNGAVIHQEGTSMGFPASHSALWVYDSFVDSMEINDNGDRLVHFNVADVAAVLPDKKLVLWTSGTSGMTYGILEEGVTPCTVAGEPGGAVWSSIGEVWQNNNNEIAIVGRSDTDGDDIMAIIAHDGAGTIVSQTAFFFTNVVHSAAFPGSTGIHADTVQTVEGSKREFAFNNSGQKMFHVDDESFGPGGMPDYTDVDSHYYIDLQEIAWEADSAPTGGGLPYNHMSSAEVDINDSGSWVAAWDDDNSDTAADGFILVDGAVFVQEGQPAPVGGGFVLEGVNFNNAGVQISSAGDITWTAEWNDPDTTKDKGLCRNFTVLIQEGVTMISGALVSDIRTSQGGDDMAVSDNGRFIIKEIHLDNGLEGVYMVEVEVGTPYCFGDGSGTGCPCGNAGASNEGCANSSGIGAVLSAVGSSSVAADDLVLVANNLLPNQPALLFVAQDATNGGMGFVFGDGLRCAGNNLVRLGTMIPDMSGEASWGPNLGAAGGWSSGDVRRFQGWYRDPMGSPCGFGFNLTNGFEVTFND